MTLAFKANLVGEEVSNRLLGVNITEVTGAQEGLNFPFEFRGEAAQKDGKRKCMDTDVVRMRHRTECADHFLLTGAKLLDECFHGEVVTCEVDEFREVVKARLRSFRGVAGKNKVE